MFVALGCAAAVAACNAIAGLGEDFTLDPNAGDGSIGKTDGADPDAQGNDAALDGLVQSDAPPDQLVSDAGPFTCVGVDAEFCDDFETATPDPNFGWSDTQRSPTAADASVTVMADAGVGGTRGLYVSMYESTTGFATGDFAWLTQSIGGADPRVNALVDVEFDIRVPDRAVDYLATGILAFPNGGAPGEFGVAAYPTNKISHTGGTAAPNAVGPNSAWHHVHITLQKDGAGTVKRTLEIDKRQQSSTATQPVPTGGGTELRLGAFNTGAGVGVNSVVFDNVLIRRQ